MDKLDLTDFVKLWQFYRRKFNAQPLDNVLVLDVFDDLKDFSLEEIHGALKAYSRKGRFAPVVADIFDILEKSQGQSLDLKANQWLARLESYVDRAYDYVSTDWRGIQAFKAVYGNLNAYCDWPEFYENQARKSFVEEYKVAFKDYVSTDWRGIQAFKAVYGNLNAYCDWPEFYENQARKSFVEEYKVAFKHNDIAEDHLVQGLYHKNRPTVRMLETLEESKAILRQLYDPRKVTLSYQPFDPAKPKALPKPQRPQLQCSLEEQQANLTQLETLLKQMSTAMKPSYSNKGII